MLELNNKKNLNPPALITFTIKPIDTLPRLSFHEVSMKMIPS